MARKVSYTINPKTKADPDGKGNSDDEEVSPPQPDGHTAGKGTGASTPAGTDKGSENPGNGSEVAKAAGIAGAAAVPTVATAGLTAAGFTSSGIAAGSMAAASQATLGNVVAGSTFATLQSVGATGGFSILGPVGLGAAAVAGGAYFDWKWLKGGPSDNSPPPADNANENSSEKDQGDEENPKSDSEANVKKVEEEEEEHDDEDEDSEHALWKDDIDSINITEENWKLLQIQRYYELSNSGNQ